VRGWSLWPGQHWLEALFRQGENPITSPEVVVRTSVQKRVGVYDARLPHAADLDMWMRLAASAYVGFLRGVDQAYYRLHEQNMRKSYDPLMDLRQRRLAFQTVLDRHGDSMREAPRMDAVVHRKLGREALWAAGRAYQLGHCKADVDEILAFAIDCWPRLIELPLYSSVRSRALLGPRAMQYMLSQKAQWWLRRRSWRFRGL